MANLKGYIRRYLPLSAVIDTLRRRKLALLDPQSWEFRDRGPWRDGRNNHYCVRANRFSDLEW